MLRFHFLHSVDFGLGDRDEVPAATVNEREAALAWGEAATRFKMRSHYHYHRKYPLMTNLNDDNHCCEEDDNH